MLAPRRLINVGPLLTGALNNGFGITLGYEIAPLKKLSIVNSVTFLQYYVDADNKNTDILTIGYSLLGRLYPLSNAVDKLYFIRYSPPVSDNTEKPMFVFLS